MTGVQTCALPICARAGRAGRVVVGALGAAAVCAPSDDALPHALAPLVHALAPPEHALEPLLHALELCALDDTDTAASPEHVDATALHPPDDPRGADEVLAIATQRPEPSASRTTTTLASAGASVTTFRPPFDVTTSVLPSAAFVVVLASVPPCAATCVQPGCL